MEFQHRREHLIVKYKQYEALLALKVRDTSNYWSMHWARVASIHISWLQDVPKRQWLIAVITKTIIPKYLHTTTSLYEDMLVRPV